VRIYWFSLLLFLISCTVSTKYGGKWVEVGYAAWYGPGFHGKRTASGEIYNMYDLTAAHKTLPFGTIVKVYNLENGRSVVVRINDRGPFVKGRIIDLSYGAAKKLGMIEKGVVRVRIEVIKWGRR
jgi:rare lipoprotein A